MTPWPDELIRILPPRLGRWSVPVFGVATALFLDPLLVMAVMDRESNGGDWLTPKGPAGVGDGGNGLGLMQIDKRYHPTFAQAVGPNGKPLWQDPVANIMYGCQILRANLDRFKSEDVAVCAYNASPKSVQACVAGFPAAAGFLARVGALDQVTTGKNYVSDVLGRKSKFQKLLTQGGNNVS